MGSSRWLASLEQSFSASERHRRSRPCTFEWQARICLLLERSAAFFAASFACAKTGKRIAARMAMMAITTRSSMSVKPVVAPFLLNEFIWLPRKHRSRQPPMAADTHCIVGHSSQKVGDIDVFLVGDSIRPACAVGGQGSKSKRVQRVLDPLLVDGALALVFDRASVAVVRLGVVPVVGLLIRLGSEVVGMGAS